jgi:diacylglycerol kinase family enzyme
MKHVFIIDPKPFYGQQWRMDGLLDSIGQFFRTQEKPDFSTFVSKYPRESFGLIQKQLDEIDDVFETVRVYAVGGDEILFDCLNSIVELPNIELAVMPYGATNDFIRAFGDGKIELFRDLPSLADGAIIPTDMISVGNNFALNGCAVGLSPTVSARIRELLANQDKGIGRFTLGLQSFIGKLATVFNKAVVAHNYKVTIDNTDYSGNYSQINIVNGPYFGRTRAAIPGVLPDDGLLDIVLFKSVGPLSLLRSLGKYSRGKISSNCIRVQAKRISIASEKPVWMQMDNELLLETSISFEVVPEAVQVVAVNDLTYQS